MLSVSSFHRSAAVLAVLIPLVVSVSTATDTERAPRSLPVTEHRTISVQSQPTIHVQLGSGVLHIRTWLHDRVRASHQNRPTDHVDMTNTRDGAVIVMESAAEDSTGLTLDVPLNARLSVYVGDGKVYVENLSGTLDVHVGRGSVHLANVRGSVTAQCDDGTIFQQVVDKYGLVEEVPLGVAQYSN